jgi:amphi-Trp domain-containing protein
MNKSSIVLNGTLAPEAFAKLLEELAASVKAGTVCLQKGGEFVTLKTAGGMEFEVCAAVKKGKQKLSLSVKWEEPCEETPVEDIKISSVEPELPPCEPELPVEPQA